MAKGDLDTEKLKHELADARLNYAKAQALFSSIGEGLIVINQYGIIEQVNEMISQILGFQPSELIGKRFMEVIRAVNEDGSIIDPLDRPIIRTYLTGSPVVDRTFYLTKYNTAVPVDINASPYMLNGIPCGAVEVIHDLTEEYAKQQIQSEFISLASHQLRTPLSSIYTYAQMLSGGYGGKLNDRQANFVSIIEHAATRMNELVHSLLNITRLEAGNISVDSKPIDVSYLCNEVVQSLAEEANSKNIDISLVSDDSFEINTDPTLLRELINNLVSNSIKYTQRGGWVIVKIEVRDRIVISINDNGFGIPEKAKSHVFSKFYRAKNIVKYDVSGTGLGLYLAKQVADKLGGDLWFNSEVGKGTSFYFSLPATGSIKKQGQFHLEVS